MSRAKQNPIVTEALCPKCWQKVSVHEQQTYFSHGKLRKKGQDPAWCSMSDRPLEPLFPLGQQVMTVGAINNALQQAKQDPLALLTQHHHGDWGDVPPEDARENILSVKQGFRILSAYTLSTGTKLWLITEADRSVSTILLPDEY